MGATDACSSLDNIVGTGGTDGFVSHRLYQALAATDRGTAERMTSIKNLETANE